MPAVASRLLPSNGLKYVKTKGEVNLILPTETNPDAIQDHIQ